jgi:leucyl/phenylalanyl-tRNA--protein transferase
MFSFVTDASKVALVHLVARLRLGRFRLLDTQFVTAHLKQFGAREIPRGLYKAQLADALRSQSRWPSEPDRDALAAEIRALSARRT